MYKNKETGQCGYRKMHALSFDADAEVWHVQTLGKDADVFELSRIYLYFQVPSNSRSTLTLPRTRILKIISRN